MTPLTAPAEKWSQAVERYLRPTAGIPLPTKEIERLHFKGFSPRKIAEITGLCAATVAVQVRDLKPALPRREFSVAKLGRRA